MRVLVCGSREFNDKPMLFKVLDRIHGDTPIKCIIWGGAPGADTYGWDWAEARGIASAVFPANWSRYGRQAGMMRNRQMITRGKPDIVVAFKVPQGEGRKKNVGTSHMIAISKAAGLEVEEHYA